jgi:hypothetical protein
MNINDKIKKLSEEDKTLFAKELKAIYQDTARCSEYGASDPSTLPVEDQITIKKNLYQQMFKD